MFMSGGSPGFAFLRSPISSRQPLITCAGSRRLLCQQCRPFSSSFHHKMKRKPHGKAVSPKHHESAPLQRTDYRGPETFSTKPGDFGKRTVLYATQTQPSFVVTSYASALLAGYVATINMGIYSSIDSWLVYCLSPFVVGGYVVGACYLAYAPVKVISKITALQAPSGARGGQLLELEIMQMIPFYRLSSFQVNVKDVVSNRSASSLVAELLPSFAASPTRPRIVSSATRPFQRIWTDVMKMGARQPMGRLYIFGHGEWKVDFDLSRSTFLQDGHALDKLIPVDTTAPFGIAARVLNYFRA